MMLTDKLFKIAGIIWLSMIWFKILSLFVGAEAASGIFLLQAIYCRFWRFRDGQILARMEKSAIPIEAEVIE
jgi:hypothetical protein